MGSVMPLVATAEALKKETPKVQFFWFGTFYGIERAFLKERQELKFWPVCSAKLRRYFDWRLLFLPLGLLLGFLESFFLLLFIRPQLVVASGSFVQVPVMPAAWLLRIPILIHQQDVQPGLANLLVKYFATKISVMVPETAKFFPANKTILARNPLRAGLVEINDLRAKKFFNLETNVPVVLVLGGSTGALSLNEQIKTILSDLVEVAQVIHITGRGKRIYFEHPRYHQYEFLGSEIFDAYAVADVVVSRAGMGVLTELQHFGSPTILVPMRGTHQDANAQYAAAAGAAILLEHDDVNLLKEKIIGLLFNTEKRLELSKNMREFFPSKQTLTDVAREMLD